MRLFKTFWGRCLATISATCVLLMMQIDWNKDTEIFNTSGEAKIRHVTEETEELPKLNYTYGINMTITWPDANDTACSKYRTTLGRDLPFIPLISFPRSGNTWLRYLLEGATGIFTGSVYNSSELWKMGYLGEGRPGTKGDVLVVKTHDLYRVKKRLARITAPDLIVFVLRDPAKSIISLWDFIVSGKTRFRDSRMSFIGRQGSYRGKPFRNLVGFQTRRWTSLATSVLERERSLIHVVFYKSLVRDPMNELRSLLNFLHWKIDEGRMLCLEKKLQGKAKRVAHKIEDPYTLIEKQNFNQSLDKVQLFLRRRGFELPEGFEE